jgi:hypothetical protein
MATNSKQPGPLQIVEEILSHPRLTHSPPPVDPALEEAKYQASFSRDAVEKADRVIEFVRQCHPAVDPARVIYVSLGGGDGAEIEHAINTGGFRKGLLLEWMDGAATIGRQRAKKLKAKIGAELEVITGDAGQKLEICQGLLAKWRRQSSARINGLLISAQAVLHELPDRSDRRHYHFQKICALYDGFDIRLFHSREPCRPWPDSGWAEDVQLRVPGVPGEKLAAAASLLQRHYGNWFQKSADAHFRSEVFIVGQDFVQMPGFVAVEFLHKFLRFAGPRNLRHEMQECLVSLNPNAVRDQLATVFGGVTRVMLEPTVSGSFRQAYLKFGIKARSAARLNEELPIPLTFACVKAFATPEAGSEFRSFESDTQAGHPRGESHDRLHSETKTARQNVSSHPSDGAERLQPEVPRDKRNPPRRRKTKTKSGSVTMNVSNVTGPVIGSQVVKGSQKNYFGR